MNGKNESFDNENTKQNVKEHRMYNVSMILIAIEIDKLSNEFRRKMLHYVSNEHITSAQRKAKRRKEKKIESRRRIHLTNQRPFNFLSA